MEGGSNASPAHRWTWGKIKLGYYATTVTGLVMIAHDEWRYRIGSRRFSMRRSHVDLGPQHLGGRQQTRQRSCAKEVEIFVNAHASRNGLLRAGSVRLPRYSRGCSGFRIADV